MNLFVLPALYLRFGRPPRSGRDWRSDLRLDRPPPGEAAAPTPAPGRPATERAAQHLTVMREGA